MKPKNQTILVIIIGILIITLALVYTLSDSFSLFTDETQESNPVLLRQLREDVVQEIKEFKMKKLIERKDLVIRKENFTQLSQYQKYVTPDDPVVKNYINTNSISNKYQAYLLAVGWTWVSDEILNNQPEKWLMPSVFIRDTPNMPTNPRPKYIVSDCESQAYTLVSILESIGIPKTNVRVVIGEVNFSGQIGGHAWVQIYDNNQWHELEATSGPFYDEDTQTVVNNRGFAYNYFKTHPYPVEEYWAFFNDNFYYNPDTGLKSPDLPNYWLVET